MTKFQIDTGAPECPVAAIVVDCRGQTCPVPLVEVRKALRKAAPGDIIEVLGTHPASKKEIPMAVQALKAELLSIEGSDTDWTIRIRR
ncbi:MAG: sulfurtransferase TusA family protein [Anaerolineae bacterium]